MVKVLRPGQRIGLMGGTFNPIHLGHLRAAEEIAETLKLDQVYFVPAAKPPHKEPKPLVSYWRRLEMIKLAVSDRPGFWASDLESQLPAPSYTINTLRAFKKIWSARSSIFFLVGLDSFMSLPCWHESRQLISLASFVVFGRAGIKLGLDDMGQMLTRDIDAGIKWNQAKQSFRGRAIKPIYYLPGGRLEISSTDLRRRLEAGASVRYLVPETVRTYIEQHGLYRPDKTA